MSDYIPLKLIIDVMCEKCGSAGFTKFKNINSLMFIGYKLSEAICIKNNNLMIIETEKQLNKYIFENNKGYSISIERCQFCRKIFDYDNYLLKIIYFKCNHSFHQICFKKKGCDTNICPICVKTEIDFSKYSEKPSPKNVNNNEIMDIEEEDDLNNETDDIEKKIEEHKKLNIRKKKILQLRRIRKMKEDFKIIFDKEFFEK